MFATSSMILCLALQPRLLLILLTIPYLPPSLSSIQLRCNIEYFGFHIGAVHYEEKLWAIYTRGTTLVHIGKVCGGVSNPTVVNVFLPYLRTDLRFCTPTLLHFEYLIHIFLNKFHITITYCHLLRTLTESPYRNKLHDQVRKHPSWLHRSSEACQCVIYLLLPP